MSGQEDQTLGSALKEGHAAVFGSQWAAWIGGILLALTNIIVDAEIPARLFEFVKQHVDSKYTFLILLNIFLLLLGAVLDIFSALVIMVPLILPLAVGYGIHPVHLGIIFLANMQIGYMTPPVGMNVFVISAMAKDVPMSQIFAGVTPFFISEIFRVILILMFPALALWLPQVLSG